MARKKTTPAPEAPGSTETASGGKVAPDFRDRNLGVRRVRVGDLARNPLNHRTHGPLQRVALKGAIRQVGWYGYPEVYDDPENGLTLVDGELRLDELLDRLGPDGEVDVAVMDFSREEARAALLTHDPISAMAGTNPQNLQALLAAVSPVDELRGLCDKLQRQAAALLPADGEMEDGEIPLPPDEATTKRGDLWILGEHRLLCGDSVSVEDVDRLVDGEDIHLVNTDPPYNVQLAPRSNNAIAAGGCRPGKPKTDRKLRAKDRPIQNDAVSDEDFAKLLDAWFGNVARVLEPGRSFYIWGGYANAANYPPFLKKHGLYFSQAIIWDKMHPVLTRKDFMLQHEWCFYGWREGAGHSFFGPNNVTDLWQVKKLNHTSMVHLTEKPVELAARAIQYSTRPNENVLDLFGGSGSTMMACERLGRRGFLMELDPLYCDVIRMRWEQETGRQATLV